MVSPSGLNFGADALSTTALMLGSFGFQNFECPEKIESFGGYQSLQIHYFPGGGISSQDFGSFPPKLIKWSGRFFNDPYLGTIQSRVQGLTQLRVAGQPVQITFGFFTYLVRIYKFLIDPELSWHMPYTIELVPVQDLNPWAVPSNTSTPTPINSNSAASSSTLTPPSNPTGGTNLTGGVSNIAPSSSNQISNLSNQNNTLSGYISQSSNYPTVPPAAITSLTNFQQQLNNAIQQSLTGNNNVNSPQLTASLNDSLTALGPLEVSNDPGIAAFAAPVGSTLSNIQNTLNNQPVSGNQITVSNPDLNKIALQQYGDSTQWQAIAIFNKPQYGVMLPTGNIGIYTLNIPTAAQAAAITSVLNSTGP